MIREPFGFRLCSDRNANIAGPNATLRLENPLIDAVRKLNLLSEANILSRLVTTRSFWRSEDGGSRRSCPVLICVTRGSPASFQSSAR